ncbi:morphogenetic protein [Raoultella planticola]|uniref:morphogenetic protein n=1 Tax=Raoultella planticola TaxID=575 RepID=UPI003D019AC1
MTERGMIFNAEMVLAILDGRKTQTRRIMKVQPSEDFTPMNMALEPDYKARWYTPGIVDKDGYLQPANKEAFGVANENEGYSCPFGAVGDRIWVRETWARYNIDQDSHDMAYRATTPADWPGEGHWRPSIHMPRWASRILLEITDVRVERLNSLSEEDAMREGIDADRLAESQDNYDCIADHNMTGRPTAKGYFSDLWQSIYGSDSWNANPCVWVIEFKRVEGGAE